MRMQCLLALEFALILNLAQAQQAPETQRGEQPATQAIQIRNRDELWQQAQALQSAGKAAEALTAGERVLSLERELYGDTDEELTETMEWLSQQYLAQQNLPQAEKYAVELQRVQEALHEKAGWQSVSARWWLDYVRKLSKVEPATLTRMLAIEAEVNRLLAEGQQADAAAEIEKLIPLEEAALGQDHPFFANTFANQSDCLLTSEQFAAAETAASRALSIRRKQLGDQHPDTAMAAFLLARSLIGQDRHSEALERLILARDAWLASGQSVNAAWMDSWRGDSLAVLKRPDEAKAAYQAALAAFREQKEAEGEAQQLKELSDLDGSVDLKVERDHLWEQARQARANGTLTVAAGLGERMLAIERVWLTHDSSEITKSLVWLADAYANLGQWGEAESLREEILQRETARLGETHWQVTDARLAVERVRLLASLTDEQRRQVKLAEHLNSEVVEKEAAGAYRDAVPIAERACEIGKTILGELHPDYATLVNNLANLHLSMADYARAEPLYVQALEISKAELGDRHPAYATSLNNLANLHLSMADYARAEPLYVQALEISKAELGDRHPAYATSLNNLAHLYVSMANFPKAEPLYVQALEIRKAELGDRHPAYATSLNNLAFLYEKMADYARAEPLYVQALEISKAELGDRHPAYVTSLNNLAGLYESMADYARAEPLYVQALEISKAELGDRHPAYATILNNLAHLYFSMANFPKAEPLYVQALEIRKAELGDRHPAYATSLNNLAGLYESMADYARAEPLYVQALEIFKAILGDRHPDYASSLNNLAGLYFSMGDAAKAEPLFVQALEISRDVLEQAALMQSERQQLAMGQMLRHRLDSYVSFTLQSGQFQVSAAREVLRWKGATLVRQRAMRLAAEDPAIADRFRALQQVSRRLASLSRATPAGDLDNWKTQITYLTAEKERLEAQLSGDSSAFRSAMEEITPQQIQAAVPRDAVLIDYLQFTRSRPAEKKGSWDFTTSLLAVIVKHDAEPQLVELGSVSALSGAIDTWRDKFGMSPQGQQAGLEIRRQIWEPLLPHIGDANTILVSVDGVLGRLPLGALPGKAAGTYLIEDHRLAMIPVSQLLPALVSDLGRRDLSRVLLLLGDVDYDSEPGAAEDSKPRPYRPSRNRGGRLSSGFKPLAASLGEIAAIQETFTGKFTPDEDDVAALKKGLATERRFRELAPQFYHLHLATHGFFESPEVRSALSSEELATVAESSRWVSHDEQVRGYNPDLLSGLAFAGANRVPADDADDGILTAQEIAFLPLGGVETVVLSACETGLGSTAGGEGLIGLQRAFQISGARTTVASFWIVDDLVTRLLMERFYANLWEKDMPRLDALREAQLYVLNSNPDAIRGASLDPDEQSRKRVSPRYWAAFTLSGDWR